MKQPLDIEIKEITANNTYTVRQCMLRPDRPLKDCVFDKDNSNSTFHLGALHNETVVGVATFIQEATPLLSYKKMYQLRGMAVVEDFQHFGCGKALIEYGETLLRKKNTSVVWCNARVKAVKFYEKCGYITIGVPFEIPKIGIHYVMYKKL